MKRCVEFLLAALMLAQLGCQAVPVSDNEVPQGYRPALDTDEGGVWMISDKAEQALKTSGQVIAAPAIQEYLEKIVCRLDPEICSDIRIYLVDMPYFNASMAPNGMMQVWTGLLLRVENEAQLAYILGHELGHYKERHSLERLRQMKSTSGALVTFQLVLGASGAGQYGDLAALLAQGTVLKFSRDHEREADERGFEMMVRAGYDPREAPLVWTNLLAEREAMDESGTFVFLSTHPSSDERTRNLSVSAEKLSFGSGDWEKAQEQFSMLTKPIRFNLLRDEIRLRKYAATQVLLDRLRSNAWNPGLVEYFQGELHRLRGEESDLDSAETAYARSLKHAGAPAQAYRELGIIYYKRGQFDKADSLLVRYLAEVPEAVDRPMIESYIGESERSMR